eukprot:TRINITY_DN3619_c0_g1_i2.p1 TRINITY_DN3619_c0_g1~~TRINITY_DN3619_c0_g1_i2.p1  ORF type:complete len:643 (+),score=157.87 TRINITY_DN3619_c0_g1_i2:36-1931(+)
MAALKVVLVLGFSALACCKPMIETNNNDKITFTANNGFDFVSSSGTLNLGNLDATIQNGLSAATSQANSLTDSLTSLSSSTSKRSTDLESSLSSSISSVNSAIADARTSLSSSISQTQDNAATANNQLSSAVSTAMDTSSSSLDTKISSLETATDGATTSLETKQSILSSAMSTVEQDVQAAISTEVETLQALLSASSFNLTNSLNDTVRISELEKALSTAITANTAGLTSNGVKDAEDRVIMQATSTSLSSTQTVVNTLSNTVVTEQGKTNTLTSRVGAVETSASSLSQAIIANDGDITGLNTLTSALSSVIVNNGNSITATQSRVKALEDDTTAATLSSELSRAKVSLATATATASTALSTATAAAAGVAGLTSDLSAMAVCAARGHTYSLTTKKCLGLVRFNSCQDVLDFDPTAPSGEYMVRGYITTCHMDDGKGWILIMKIPNGDANQKDFAYNGNAWKVQTPINHLETDLNTDKALLHPLYYEYPIAQVRLAMKSLTVYHDHNQTATSAWNLFNGAERMVNQDYTRDEFLSWAGNLKAQFANQPNCNERAFHIQDEAGVKCRYGMSVNNEPDCRSSDAAMGMGCYVPYNNRNIGAGASYIGRNAQGGNIWDGKGVLVFNRGWIFVR